MWLQNGYILWSFQGAKLFESEKHKMFSLAWRPRPEGLLSEEEAKAVVRDLKKHISRFTEEDKRADARRALLERLRKRRSLNEFRAMLATVATNSEKRLQILHEAGHALDHPVPAHFLEGRYLKCIIARVGEPW